MSIHNYKNEMILTIFASILAANGLLSNNIPAIIGSMLISPYLAIIANISKNLYNKKIVIHEYVVLGISISISLIVGILYYMLQTNITPSYTYEITTGREEMISRANLNRQHYISTFIYAITCGLIFNIVNCNNRYNESTKIIINTGLAIGVSLLPPVVNSGLFLVENNKEYALNSLLLSGTTMGGVIIGIVSAMYIGKL